MSIFNLSLHNPFCLKPRLNKGIFSFLIAGVLAYLFSLGAVQAPDSWGYLQANILRSPGYPLFIKLIQFVSEKHAETLLVIAQLFLGLWATLVVANSFQKIFGLKQVFFVLFAALLFTPYLAKTGNYILTEGLAYPLFLFSIHYLLKGLIYRNNLALGIHFVFLTALVLTRGQFLFMYGVTSLGLLHSFQYNHTFSKRALLILSLLGSFFLSNILDKTYHAFYHGAFTSTPFTGIHLCIQPLYVSQVEDASLFEDPRERNFFLETSHEMEGKKLSSTFEAGHIDPPYHFYAHFNEILYQVMYPALSKQGLHNAIEVDGRLKKMAIKLILNRPLAYFKLYIRNVAGILGGYYKALILLLLFIAASFYSLRYRHPLSICLSLCSLIVIGNALLVACVQPALLRYAFYAEVISSCLFLVILYRGFEWIKALGVQ